MKYLSVIVVTCLFVTSCDKKSLYNKESAIAAKVKSEAEQNANKRMSQEYIKYLGFTKTCKNKYEAFMYIDTACPTIRQTYVEAMTEKKWKEQLEWLRTHEYKLEGYSEGGAPMFHGKEKNPYAE